MSIANHTTQSPIHRTLLKAALAFGLVLGLTFAATATRTDDAYADTATDFATRLYTQVLGRPADAAGLQTQVNALNSGWQPAEIAYNYFNSLEYFKKHESAQRTVERCYQVMFGRDPKDGEEADWVKKMQAGMSVRAIVQGFSQSQEYRNYFGEAGLDSSAISLFSSTADQSWDSAENQNYAGGNYRDLNEGATEFSVRMYSIVLKRTRTIGVDGGIDVGGLNAQCRALVSGTPCWQIAFNFFGSEEFANFGYSNEDVVYTAYRAILGRLAEDISEFEVMEWEFEKEAECYSDTDIVLHFCNSNEFNDNVCAPYGLTSGMRGATAAKLPTPSHGNHTWGTNKCTHCHKPMPSGGRFAMIPCVSFCNDEVYPWVLQEDGSVKSNTMGMDNSWTSVTIDPMYAGTFTFDWRIESEFKYDGLVIRVVDHSIGGWDVNTGEGWDRLYTGKHSGTFSIDLEEGQILEIAYEKDASNSYYSDCVWISNPVFVER